MNRKDVVKLLDMLAIGNIRDREDWVMASCPFAKTKHSNGTDRHPSFGVSVGRESFYNCFSCGSKGPITALPSTLSVMRGKDYKGARDFVFEKEALSLGDYERDTESTPLPEPIPMVMLKRYDPPPLVILKRFSIEKETAEAFGILYDPLQERLLFPTRNREGKIVALRGRHVGKGEPFDGIKYRVYSELSPNKVDPKRAGLWFGGHFKLTPKRALVLVEGERDMLALYQSGLVHNVWASMGASISNAQAETVKGWNGPVVLFLDDDEAGREAKSKLARSLRNFVPLYHLKNYHGCKDADEAVRRGVIKIVLDSLEVYD